MNRKILYIIFIAGLFLGCAVNKHVEEFVYEGGKIQKYKYYDDTSGKYRTGPEGGSVFLDIVDIIKRGDEYALPELRDLPLTEHNLRKRKRTRSYTGVIQNYTKYDISIPASNSAATILVPAQGWMEYTTWSPTVHLDGYVEGQKIYHQKIVVQPKKYKHMGKEYDFVAAIGKEVVPPKKKPVRKKKPKPKVEVEGLG